MRVLIVVVILLSLPEQVRAEVRLGRTTMSFATVEEGKQVLTSRDDYVERMSAFDRAARLKTDWVIQTHAGGDARVGWGTFREK